MRTAELFTAEVGYAVGDVWQPLDIKGSLSVTEVVKTIDAPRDQIMQSIGWLAREGEMTVQVESRRKIALLLP